MITQGDRIRDNKATSHMLLKECGVDDASSTPKKKKKLVKLAH
jgi:high-affinity K+ transport system ATPase subunit B